MADDFQEIRMNSNHSGKVNVTGELSIPELADLVTPPLGPNAMGMKEGVVYHWNHVAAAWQPVAPPDAEVEYGVAISSEDITSQFMDATFTDWKSVLFTNLTDYPANVAVVSKYATGWYMNLYGNKLA